jgi:hypothetical protein
MDYIIVEADYSTPGTTDCTGSSATLHHLSGQCITKSSFPNNSKRFCCNKDGSSVSYVYYSDTKCSSTKVEDSWTEPSGTCKTGRLISPQSFTCVPKPPPPAPCATDYIVVETDYSTPGTTDCTGSSSGTVKYNSGQCFTSTAWPKNSKRLCCNKDGSSVSYIWYGDTKCSKAEDFWTEPTGKCKTDTQYPQSFNCLPKLAPETAPPPPV